MKKFFIYFLFSLAFLGGCSKKEVMEKEEKKEKEIKEEVIETPPSYQDSNETPISFYSLKGNRLEKINSLSGSFRSLDDLGLFQIYPSNEQTVLLNTSFANSFYDTWQLYNPLHTLKIGFSLTVPIEGKETLFYNILSPGNTMDHWEYFMAYLYDDYANRGKYFYSHIEMNEYNDSTLFTAFKLQCGTYCNQILSPVILSVFTYDSEDDFLDGVYRGNSQSTLSICMHGDC